MPALIDVEFAVLMIPPLCSTVQWEMKLVVIGSQKARLGHCVIVIGIEMVEQLEMHVQTHVIPANL